jgi:adenylate cyclase
MINAAKSQPVRRPIGLKIFGIALVLLVLMSVVTLISALHQRNVEHELDILASYFIPLDQKMGQVRLYGVGQILVFERLLNSDTIKRLPDAAAIAENTFKQMDGTCAEKLGAQAAKLKSAYPANNDYQQVLYELIKICAEIDIKDATVLIKTALDDPFIKTDLTHNGQFSDLRRQLKDIPDARAELNNTVYEFIDRKTHAGKMNVELMQRLEKDIDTRRSKIGREIRDVTDALHKFTLQSATRTNELQKQSLLYGWSVTGGAIVLGFLFAAIITRNLVRPVRELLIGTRKIEDGDFDVQVNVSSTDEIASLTESFNRMVSGLKQKESIRETFGKYIDPRVVQGLIGDHNLVEEGEKKIMTVFFSDLQGFTTLCEQLSPAAVVKFLNHYFTTMSEPIREHKGVIDKYIGDAVMAFWGPPFTSESEHAALACKAAIDQHLRLGKFRQTLPDVLGFRKGLPDIYVRMGIATGDVTVGSIGSTSTKSYTVVGDTVNLASRLEAANKQYGTHIIISEDTWKRARNEVETRELDCIRVFGKSEAVRIFELLGYKDGIDATVLELRDNFEKALGHYRKGEWERADASFTACLSINPHDGPSQLFIARLKHLRERAPADAWTGVWDLTEK